MLEALLLGERRNIDPDTYEAFRRTGLLHLISLSGMHLCILIDIVWRFGKLVGLAETRPGGRLCRRNGRSFCSSSRPSRRSCGPRSSCGPSAHRSSCGDGPNPLNSLSLAAIILLLIQPTQLFDVGWQLSFAATAGILAFTRPIEDRLRAGPAAGSNPPAWEPDRRSCRC